MSRGSTTTCPIRPFCMTQLHLWPRSYRARAGARDETQCRPSLSKTYSSRAELDWTVKYAVVRNGQGTCRYQCPTTLTLHNRLYTTCSNTVNRDSLAIQPLYTKICDSALPELSSLTNHPHVLLHTLLTLSITQERIPVIKQLLAITPSPRPDLKRFLCRLDAAFSPMLTALPNPRIRALMVRHGYQKSDRPGTEIDQPLYDAVLGNGDLEALSALLSQGSRPKLAHLRLALKLQPLSVLKILLTHYPVEEPGDCRLLHDVIAEGKLGKPRCLVDVVRLDIDMFPTERAEQDGDGFDLCGVRTGGPNGTPVHEAIRYGRKLILEWLWEWDARTDVGDEDGETAFEVARKEGKKEIVACLPDYKWRNRRFESSRGWFGRGWN
ncbi:hypothetical protein VTL71DRAFT_12630 [Oculimacula yallundae]|uniref:Ankyrin n=1 Tax=Oculimacula yallundae TaxID=86028 RepID=A0ABR4CNL2_9HELO